MRSRRSKRHRSGSVRGRHADGGRRRVAFEPLESRRVLTAAFQVNDSPNSSFDPAVASAPNGDFVVVWTYEYDGAPDYDYDIYGRRYSADGTPKSTSDDRYATNSDNEVDPDVAMDEDGNTVVVYERTDTSDLFSDRDIYFQRVNAAGQRVGSAVKVNTEDGGDEQVNAQVAMDFDGSFVVVWENHGGALGSSSGYNLQYRRFNADGSPRDATEQFVGFGYSPSVAMEKDSGDFVITYYDETMVSGRATPDQEILFKLYSSSGSQVTGGTVYSDRNKDQDSPSVGMDSSGRFAIAWEHEHSATDTDIYVQLFNSNGTKDGSAYIVAGTSKNEWSPQVSMSSGEFVVGFGESQGNGDIIALGRRYDGNTGFFLSEVQFGDPGFDVGGGDTVLSLANLVSTVDHYPGTNNQVWAQIYTDRIVGTNGPDTLTGTNDDDEMLGLGGNDTLKGLGGNDTITGGGGDDRIEGQGGDDKLRGKSGNDTMIGGPGNDNVLGQGGDDTLRGKSANDVLNGGSGNDSLQGQSGQDVLLGGGNDDRLNGGPGNDILEGGPGRDIFTVQPGTGRDVARDFTPGRDRLNVARFFSSFQQFRNKAVQQGNNVLVTLNNSGDKALLKNVNRGDIKAHDVIVGSSTNAATVDVLFADLDDSQDEAQVRKSAAPAVQVAPAGNTNAPLPAPAEDSPQTTAPLIGSGEPQEDDSDLDDGLLEI